MRNPKLHTQRMTVSIKSLRAGNLTLDEAIRARLRHVHFGILASVLDILVPAQVYQNVSMGWTAVDELGKSLGGIMENLPSSK